MGNRSHLRPSATIDKNGRATTVYVTPDDHSPSFSMLSSIAPSLPSYDDDDADDDWSGEDITDAESWQANEFSLDDAYNWEGEGFDADTAYNWRANGFDSSDASEWHQQEFSADEASGWKEHCSADTARQWVNDGFDADEAQPWIAAGFDSDDAKGWSGEGFDQAETAKSWAGNGFDYNEAREWSEAGFREPDVAADWKGESSRVRNLNMDDLLAIYEAGQDSQDAPMWLSLLDTVHSHGEVNETITTVMNTMYGSNPSAGDAYSNYFPYSKWSILSGNGIDFDQVRHVDKLKNAVANRDEEEYGEDYEEDPDGDLETAAAWVSQTAEITNGKAQVIENLILAGESIQSCKPFLSSAAKEKYDSSEECLARVRAAQEWARAAEAGTESDTFDQLYTVLTKNIDIKTFGEMVETHGVTPVRSALSHGLETEAQVRNYLEHSGVSSISEGAL